jgi:hypothetical protein
MNQTRNDGWTLVSDAKGHHLRTTGVVHHINGCQVNNGRNRLREALSDDLVGASRCQRCERILTGAALPARPVVGTKVEVRLPDDTLNRLDAIAKLRSVSRAEIIREMVVAGLAQSMA